MVRLVLNKETVERIAALYDAEYDTGIFPADYVALSHLTREELDAAGYAYPVRSHLTVDELQAIMDWKSPRQKTRRFAAGNGSEMVAEVTREAFAATDPVDAVQALCRLHGVWVAMASAILTSYDPLRFTVIDVRAWTSLKKLGLLEQLGLSKFDGRLDEPETYGAYRDGCSRLADDAGVSLRSLDRCLWTLDEKGLYDWVRHGVTLAPIVNPSASQPVSV